MTTNTTLKELLNVAPQAGRVAHALYGIDFLKPYHIARIDGNFTTKKVLNNISHAGLDPYNSKMLIYVTSEKVYNRDRLYLVTLHADGDFSVNLPKKLWTAGNYGRIDVFFRKGDFNDIRKDETATAYIIAQAKENTTPDKPREIDRKARFKYVDHETHTAKDGTKYVTRVKTRRTDDTGTAYTINDHGNFVYTSQLEKYRELSEIIDKSGYITMYKRDSLKRIAGIARSERQKAEFLQTDHTAELEAITAELEATRDRLAEELKQAQTYEAIKATAEKIDRWKGLTGIYYDYELLKKRTAGNEYGSNEGFNKALANIHEALATL